jgi:hypothetical protein
LTQEVLRAREERIASEATEATEAPLIAPTQGKDIHLVQDAWEKELLMLERVQRVLDQLQDDLDLSEMTGSPIDNPERSHVGTSGPKFIDVDELVGLDDLEITMPPTVSPEGVVTQP